MATITNTVRWADNTQDLVKNIMQGVDTIDAMQKAVDRTANSLGGSGLLRAANNTVAAIQQLGGVTKLTASEQERATALLDKAIEKYHVLGMEAPSAMRDLADSMKHANDETGGWLGLLQQLGGSFVARVAEGMLLRDAIREVLSVVKEGITAFPELIEHTIKTGNSLYEMSLKTGASVENLSALRYVASQTGIDFDSFGISLFKMEKALGANGAAADQLQKHLSVLGLDMQTLKNEKPDQAFIDIMSALEQIPNRMDQAAAGAMFFGKGFKDMSGLAQENIHELLEEAKSLGLVMSTETAAAAHAAEVGFKSLQMQLESVEMRIGAAFIPALVGLEQNLTEVFQEAIHEANDGLNKMGGSGGFLATVATAMGTGDKAIAAQVQLYEDLKAVMISVARGGIEPLITAFGFAMTEFNAAKVIIGDVMQGLELLNLAAAKLEKFKLKSSDLFGIDPETQARLKDVQADIDRMGASIDARGRSLQKDKQAETDWSEWSKKATHEVEEAVDILANSHTDAAKTIADFAAKSKSAYGGVGADVEGAAEKVDHFANALKELDSVGKGWVGTLDTIDGSVVEAIKYYLAAGVAQEKLAITYNVTAVQVKAVESALKSEIETTKLMIAASAEAGKSVLAWIAETSKAARAYVDDHVKAYEEALAAARSTENEIALLGVSGAMRQQKALEQKEQAELEGLAHLRTVYPDIYAQIADQVHQKYQMMAHDGAAATKDIIDVAHDLGIKTKEDIAGNLELARNNYDALRASGVVDLNELQKAWKTLQDAETAANGGVKSWGQTLEDTLMKVPALVAQAFASGGGISGALQGVASLFGASGIGKLFGNLAKSMTGFMKGLMPVIGEALGSLVGPLVQWIAGMFDHVPADIRNKASNYGAQISDEVMQGIRKDMDSLHLTEQAATIFNASKLFPTVDATNFGAALRIVHDGFSMVATGQLTVAQQNTVLTDMFPKLEAASTDALGHWSAGLKEIIRLDAAAGTANAAIAAALKGQGADALAGFTAMTAGMLTDDKLKVWDDLKKKLSDADAEVIKQGGGMGDYSKVSAAAAKAQTDAWADVKAAAASAKSGLADVGIQAVASFAAAVASGTSEADALKAIHPALASLEKSYDDLGISTDDAALKALMMRDKIATAAPALTAGIGGLSSEMVALSNMGLLNVNTFGAMERTGQSMYDQLSAKVKELGGSDADALGPMQTFLHNAEKAAKDLGVPLDENTQKLIDQSKDAGVWQTALTPQEQLLAGMQSLVDKVGDLIDRLNGIPKKIDTTVTTSYQTDGTPREIGGGTPQNGSAEGGRGEYAATGGYVAHGKVLQFARGGIVPRYFDAGGPVGTDTVNAWLTPGESVLTREATSRIGLSAIAAMNGGDQSAVLQAQAARSAQDVEASRDTKGGGDTFIVTVNAVDAAGVASFFDRNKVEVAKAFNEAVRMNKGGTYTQARGALGLAS